MVYKRSLGAGTTLIFVFLFIIAGFALLIGVDDGNWFVVAIGVLVLLGLVAALVFALMSAKYYINEDCLHIKGINYGYREDRKIAYRDILYISQFVHNKVDFLSIVYWDGVKANQISIPAPSNHIANNRSEQFINSVLERVNRDEQSHIISPHLIHESHTCIVVELADCLFTDYVERNGRIMIALIKDGSRIILLGDCKLFTLDKIVQKMPPVIEKTQYISCGFSHMQHLEYETIEEAIADVGISRYDGKERRMINLIAEDLRMPTRDTRSARKKKGQ